MPKSGKFICPVCGFAGLKKPAYDTHKCASFEIFPCCLVEFGYDDATKPHAELRKKWLEHGAFWGSATITPPSGWSALKQLQAAGLDPFEEKKSN